MTSVNNDVERARFLLGPIAEKLGLSCQDLEKDISAICNPIVELLLTANTAPDEPLTSDSSIQNVISVTTSQEADEMDGGDVFSPGTTTEPSDEMETDQEVVREEGEASDEGEEDGITS